MTREPNKQWRDDQRPSFRSPSSNQRGDERPSRPARPRLNREVVDRAWKDGAQPHHSDYHPRTSNRPYSQNGRNGQRSEYSSSQSRPGNNNFNGNRRDNAQSSERTPSNYQGPRSRSFEPDRRNPDNRRFGERNGYNERPNERGVRSNGNYPQRTQDYRDRDRNFTPGRYERDERPRQGPSSPRPGSRPFARDDRPSGPRRSPQDRHHQEQFEGDYERFTNYDEAKPQAGRPRQEAPRGNRNGTYERDRNVQRAEPARHVTQMVDGRVIKGSRPEQRKEAHFWTAIADDAGELVQKVQTPDPIQEETAPVIENVRARKSGPRKQTTTSEQPRRRTASAVTRKKNVTAPKPHATGPRPSQRGFKWPTA